MGKCQQSPPLLNRGRTYLFRGTKPVRYEPFNRTKSFRQAPWQKLDERWALPRSSMCGGNRLQRPNFAYIDPRYCAYIESPNVLVQVSEGADELTGTDADGSLPAGRSSQLVAITCLVDAREWLTLNGMVKPKSFLKQERIRK